MSLNLEIVEPKTQNEAILEYLQSGKTLTPLEALDKFGCLRLGGRIFDLKRLGHKIKTDWEVSSKKKWAKYSLEV